MKQQARIEKVKNNNGITLISLVVTIIVLIILSGVSINAVVGEEGIIRITKQSKQDVDITIMKEEIQLKILEAYSQKMLSNEDFTEINLKNILGAQAIIDSQTGNVTGVKIQNKEIPIKEITQGINVKKLDSNKNIEGESGYLGSGYDDPYIPVGFNHTKGKWNSGYTIKDSLNNEFVWVPCVTNQSKVKAGDKVQTFKKTLPTTTGSTDYYYMYNKNNATITGDASPAEAIRISVETYGGFYIAAYEAGLPLDGNGNEVTSPTTLQKARSVAGATVWTDITRANAIDAAKNMIESSSAGVKSGLISGECWDTTLQWMVNSSTNATREPNVGYDIDSTGNAWDKDVSNNSKTTTGQYPINNIYDMAGNTWEWTTENCMDNGGGSCLVFRGGSYDYSSSDYPAAYRTYGSDNERSFVSFRVVLYK